MYGCHVMLYVHCKTNKHTSQQHITTMITAIDIAGADREIRTMLERVQCIPVLTWGF